MGERQGEEGKMGRDKMGEKQGREVEWGKDGRRGGSWGEKVAREGW